MEINIQEDKPEQGNELNRINNDHQVNEIIRKESIYLNQNEQKKNTLFIKDNSGIQLNLFNLINKINSSKADDSQKIENQCILNLLLMSSKLNNSNKLICLLLLFFLNHEDKKDFNINLTNYLFKKISKLLFQIDKNQNLLNYILLKESQFLQNKKSIFYSREYILKIKGTLSQNPDPKLLTTIDNLFQDIDKIIKSYLDDKKNQFLNKGIINDNRLNYLKDLIYSLVNEKYTINEDFTWIYLINKDWVFKTKLFIEPFIEARKENIESLLLEDSFNIEKVYHSFVGAQGTTLKNYFGVTFPGPVNNYCLLDFKDHWVDPEILEENIMIKSDLKLNEHYLYLLEKDWIFLRDIFDVTNEIKRKKMNENFFKIKIVVFDPRLSLKENKHLLRKRIIQVNEDSTLIDFKNKIIRCVNYEISKSNEELDKKVYDENEVSFYLLNKKNKDLLIEMISCLTNNNKIYESLYIQQIKFNSGNESIKNLVNYYNKEEYLLIAEIIPKNGNNFFKPILPSPELNNSNIYNCEICNEHLNLFEKYECDLCNYSLFCCEECSKISGAHNNLHEILDQIYIKKIDIQSVLNQELKLTKENPKGLISLTKEKHFSGINSIIQCLSNSIDFTKYFINNVYINDLSIIDYLTNKETFAFKYYNLIKEMWISTKINQNLDASYKDFIRLLLHNLKIKLNDIAAMNDIARILDFLLNNFHKELNRCANVEKTNINNEKEEKGAEHYLNQNQSIITDLFQGIFQSVLHCSKCGNASIIYSPFNTILLPMPKKNNNLSIKYFNEFECKSMRFNIEENSTVRDLKDKALSFISDKINHLIHIMSLTELIDVAAFDTDEEDERVLTYITMYNSIELVQFDKNKVLTKVYLTDIQPKPEKSSKDNDNNKDIKKIENNDLKLQLSKIYKENNDIELVFYEKSVVEESCVNIYVYPFIYNEKEKLSKNRDKMLNVYPIAISAQHSLVLENFEHLVNVKLRDLLIEHFQNESEKRVINYIELVVPHYFCNSIYYSGAICPICNDKRKNSLFCPLFSAIDKQKTIDDLLLLFKYPEQPVILLAKCKYYDPKKQIYSNMNCFPNDNSKKSNDSNRPLEIYDCFDLYTRKEKFNQLYCENCKGITTIKKEIIIHKPPLYLILQLNRISFKKGSRVIDDTLINVPINNLDIGEFVQGPERNKAKYNLYAVINRELSSRNDNSYSVCENGKKWVTYKDGKILTKKTITDKHNHFLFYRRKDLPDY